MRNRILLSIAGLVLIAGGIVWKRAPSPARQTAGEHVAVPGGLAWAGAANPAEAASTPAEPVVARLPRAALALHEGKLRVSAEDAPFTGVMFEQTLAGGLIAEVPVQDGLVHGPARGWHENGRLEVEETFVLGQSHGERTRWHANGAVRSKANIVKGVLQGPFVEWYENGQLKARMHLVDGLGEGLCETWAENGQALPAVTLKAGQPVGALADVK